MTEDDRARRRVQGLIWSPPSTWPSRSTLSDWRSACARWHAARFGAAATCCAMGRHARYGSGAWPRSRTRGRTWHRELSPLLETLLQRPGAGPKDSGSTTVRLGRRVHEQRDRVKCTGLQKIRTGRASGSDVREIGDCLERALMTGNGEAPSPHPMDPRSGRERKGSGAWTRCVGPER